MLYVVELCQMTKKKKKKKKKKKDLLTQNLNQSQKNNLNAHWEIGNFFWLCNIFWGKKEKKDSIK